MWGGVEGRGTGRKSSLPPTPAVLLAGIQKGPFSASVRAAQLGREGGGGGRRYSRVGEPGSPAGAVTTAQRRQDRTEDLGCPVRPAAVRRGQSPWHLGDSWDRLWPASLWNPHKAQKWRPLPGHFLGCGPVTSQGDQLCGDAGSPSLPQPGAVLPSPGQAAEAAIHSEWGWHWSPWGKRTTGVAEGHLPWWWGLTSYRAEWPFCSGWPLVLIGLC